jgi:hypothetical protein
MTDLQKWEAVNQCKTAKELETLILENFSDGEGKIQGRSKKFDTAEMLVGLTMFMKNQMHPNILTREFGIRQQAIYLKSIETN